MGDIYFPLDRTPEQWRELARESDARARESFDRCDTDGFLSQGASQAMASLYRLCADVAEQGGLWEFPTLCDREGVEIPGAREVQTRYGWAWLAGGQWFNPSNCRDKELARSRDLAKGFQIIKLERPAVVAMSSSGMFSWHPVVLPRHSPDRREPRAVSGS